jgi:hypothetical protein
VPTSAVAQQFDRQITSQVKDGVFDGQIGTVNQPNSLTVDGAIQLDGSSELFIQGFTSDPAFTVGQVATGTKYSYHVVAKFEGTSGTGARLELRPCSFSALKQ